MNKELLWDLFSKTGKIEYYILYKEMSRDKFGKSYNSREDI